MFERLKGRARLLKKELTALYYAARDPRMPAGPKILLVLTLAYALSPIDLIPDFIPVLGYLDDLLIVPALLAWAIRLIPDDIMADARLRAEKEPVRLGKNPVFAVVFVLIWIALLAALVWGGYKAVTAL